MVPAAWTQGVIPIEIARWARLTEAAFVRAFGGAPLLAIAVPTGQLICVAGPDAEAGGAEGSKAPPVDSLDFLTSVIEQVSATPTGSLDPTLKLDAQVLIHRLARSPRQIIRLEKRPHADHAHSDRISVGRELKQDIVLRHRSISKLHAYFRCERQGSWALCDAGSKNGTLLNGHRLSERKQQPLTNGDQIAFGAIDAIFLDPSTLWRVLRTVS